MSTNGGFDDCEIQSNLPGHQGHNSHSSNLTLNLSEFQSQSNYASGSSQQHKRIKSVLNTLQVEEEEVENSADRERSEAFKKVQEMVAAATPKADLPFGISSSDEPEIKPAQKKRQFDFNEDKVEEPTAASTTQPVTTKSEGDYTNVRQTTSTNAQMEIIEEEQDDHGAEILNFIELKYCTVCHLEIPLRAKHCK